MGVKIIDSRDIKLIEYIITMNRILRSLFILGIAFYLVKGQSSLYASSDCTGGDPVITAVELVLSDAPDDGVGIHPTSSPNVVDAPASASSQNNHHSGYEFVSAHHDNYTRIVLPSCMLVYLSQARSSSFCTTRTLLHQSADSDPLLQS